MDFTPEQQEYIDNLILEKTKGLFTEEELNRRVTSEVDRRVESGIQKGLETQKSKWEEEFERKSKLTAEELANAKLEDKLSEINSKQEELSIRENTLEAKSMLANAEISKEHYEKFVEILVSGDIEGTKVNVQNFIDTFNETKTGIEKNLQEKYAQIPPPNSGKSSGEITKEQFRNMSYMETLELKRTNESLYNELIKQ